MKRYYLALPLVALAATPAHAELPEPVRTMIDAAIATGDAEIVATVASIARSTNPDDAAEIDGLLAAFANDQREMAVAESAAEEMAIREAGLFDKWSGEGQIGAFQSSGNTSSMGLSAQLELERGGIRWEHNLRAAADYRRSNGVTEREQFLAAYEPHYRFNERLYAFALGQYERDRFQGYSARYSTSAGLGYTVIDTDSLEVSLQAGPAWRKTQFVTGASSSHLAARAAGELDWQIADNISLTEDVSIIVDSDTSLVSSTGLEAGINSSLTARLSYTVEYDSGPPLGAVSTDTLTRFTLIYGF